MLHFGVKPPLSFGKFLQHCEGLIPEEDIAFLEAGRRISEYVDSAEPSALRKWREFDLALRNELVKVRAAHKKIDPLPYLRGDGYVEPSITHIALHAYRSTSLLEAEKILDEERWRFLDELAVGHFFDLDFLIVYALKLLILEHWEKIRVADTRRALQEALKND